MATTSSITAQDRTFGRTRQHLVNFGLFMAEGFVVQGCSVWDVRLVEEARGAVRGLRRTGTSPQGH